MQTYNTEKKVAFSNRLLRRIYERSIFDSIVNRDYEGEIKDKTSILKIGSIGEVGWDNYTGSITYHDLQEIVATFTTDQKKELAFKIKDIAKFESFIDDPKSTVFDQEVNTFKQMVDAFVLGFYGDVAAGQSYGTDYTTGTVAVAATTGVVTGTGTTFASTMVGKGFKATGHSKWYRVKTYTSATEIVIENDSDDEASAYDGGAISAGASYTIQAATVKTIDNSTTKFLAMVDALKLALDEAEVPEDNRWLVIPARGEQALRNDPGIKLDVPAAYEHLVEKGFLTMLLGFKVFRSNQVAGDNTNGYHVLAGHNAWLTFADGLAEGPETLRLESDFASAYRELRVYGAKVADERRKFAAHAFVKFS